jgi:anti-sigma factor RsiW
MKDERIIELVNGELDGTNSPSDHTELTTLLDREPSVKALFDEMQKVDRLLAAVPMVDPPATLKSNVMYAIGRQGAPARTAARGWLDRILAPFVQRPAWAVAYAFAIGIIVGLGVLTVIQSAGPDTGMVQGTIGAVRAPALAKSSLSAGTATADIVISALDDELRVDVKIVASDAATLQLTPEGGKPIVIESAPGTPVYGLLMPRTGSVSIELASNEDSQQVTLTIQGSTE